MIDRVVKTIRSWGEKFGYFDDAEQAQIFEDELTHLILYQKGSFNSPVWFNVGVKERPQCSACFILAVEDDMKSILDWIKTEGMIFKGGSGAGINLSPLRSKLEPLSKGGYASGPVSFMRGADAVAGMIKSGGTTRRAAKMVVLDIDHPDIMDFIQAKAEEEKKIRALMAAGYDMSDLNNEAWHSIQFQNANNSVRITDEFMKKALNGEKWSTRFRTSGEPATTYDARELLEEIAKAAWECGDPGVQFDTTINDWHTCPNSGRINASNPCSEYMHLDNSACNLASINLLKFLNEDGTFKADKFRQAVDIFILAQEIIVDGSSYPTRSIAKTAHDFRELGLGFSNLGALLMTKGLPYDSDEARAVAGAISALMAGEAYRYSALIARRMKPFNGFGKNREPMLRVINKHLEASKNINRQLIKDEALESNSLSVWQEAYQLGQKYGYRNSQVTVIAPTGTISFMMGCDTTGIEPEFSLVKMKQLVGGGWMKIVNKSVPAALRKLGYPPSEVKAIVDYVFEKGTIEDAPYLKEEHVPIFDCAVKPVEGHRSISWRGHVKMVAAVQPFISGAISKTFNMPHETTVSEITEAYIMAWQSGIKAFAVYRDGSKTTQPLYSGSQKEEDEKGKEGNKNAKTESGQFSNPQVIRRRLPATRLSETHKFSIAGHEGYLTYSTYRDGKLAEIFIRMAKQGSTLAGLLDAFAISVSMALQYGVPFKDLAAKFIYSRFEPAGVTENPDIRIATSILDYIFRYLAYKFLTNEERIELGLQPALIEESNDDLLTLEESEEEIEIEVDQPVRVTAHAQRIEEANLIKDNLESKSVISANVCRKCGGIMVRTGTCETCLQCGASSGGCS